jgi:hypothetical protein
MLDGSARQRRAEAHSRVWPATQRQPHLARPEQIEMVDEERYRQDRRPSGGKHRPQHNASGGVFNCAERQRWSGARNRSPALQAMTSAGGHRGAWAPRTRRRVRTRRETWRGRSDTTRINKETANVSARHSFLFSGENAPAKPRSPWALCPGSARIASLDVRQVRADREPPASDQAPCAGRFSPRTWREIQTGSAARGWRLP